MDDYLLKVSSTEKVNNNKLEQNNDNNMAKSEISSLHFKASSDFGTIFADSAYSSLGHSAFSSLGPINPPFLNKKPPSNPSSKFSGSGYKDQPTYQDIKESNVLFHDKQIKPLGQRVKEKKKSFSKSLTKRDKRFSEKEQIEKRKEEQPFFPSSQDTKAAKLATISQALGFVDQFRKAKASKDEKSDKGHDINELVTNLLQACQGFKGTSTIREGIKEILEGQEDIPANQDGEGFCVAVSLQDGMVIHTTSALSCVLGYLLLLTHFRETPVCEIMFAPIFWHNSEVSLPGLEHSATSS